MSGWRQVTAPIMSTVDLPGMCARFQWKSFGSRNGWGFGSATAAWNGQAKKHPGEWPPSGVSVPIWLSWAKDPNGHAAISLADGRVLTSPVRGTSVGQEIYPSIQAMMNAFGGGMTYLGWGEQMDGTVVVERVNETEKIAPKSGQEEQENDMNYIYILGKSGVRKGGLYAVFNGREAVFLGNIPAPAGVPQVKDEDAIAELQKRISGLR